MKLSVVIPTYNGARTIGDQLEALARQRWRAPVEVVVSDNGSTDDTRTVAARFGDRFPRFAIIDSSDVAGAAHARNVGASAATGDYLLFCDDDDQVGEHWLDAMAAALAEHPFVAARLEHRRLNPPWVRDVYGEPQSEELPRFPGFIPHAWGTSLGIRRDLHAEIGGWDERLRGHGEDIDYCYRLQMSGTPLFFAPDAVVHYRNRCEAGEIFRQFRGYGKGWGYLFERYSDRGLQRPHQSRVLGSWLLLGLRLPLYVPSRRRRAVWASWLGWKLGTLEGTVERRAHRQWPHEPDASRHDTVGGARSAVDPGEPDDGVSPGSSALPTFEG